MTINPPRKVTASSGWQWINQGARYFMSSKLNWLSAVFFVGLLSVLLIKISPVFQLALVFILPFVTVGFSMACNNIEQGGKMSVEYIAKGFQNPNKFNIFRYGILLMLMMIVAQVISSIIISAMGISSEQLMQAMELLKTNEEQSPSVIFSSPVLLKFFMVSIITLLPVMVINLLAPIILAFSNYTPIIAIKLSFSAGIKNIHAFAVYGALYLIMILFIVFALQFLISILITLFGENSSIALIIYMFAFIICLLTIASLSYCSAYVAFKDLFIGEDI